MTRTRTPKSDDRSYAARVAALEAEGLTTSDAQAAADAEAMRPRRPRRTPAEKVADGRARAAAQRSSKADRETKDGQKRCAAGRQRKDGTYAYGIVAKTRCPSPVHRPSAALCQKHEAEWRAQAKKRAAAKAS